MAFALTTPQYTMSAPNGWDEKLNAFGMDAFYVGNFNSDAAPVFTVMTGKKSLKPQDLASFLKADLKRDFDQRKIKFKIKSEGRFQQIPSPNYFAECEYSTEKGLMRDYILLVQGKNQFHMLTLSTRSGDFDFYFKDVGKSLESFRLTK